MTAKTYNLSDFSLIKSSISEFADSMNISELSLAFMPYYLMQLFNDLQLDEIYDCITDTQFTNSVVNAVRGHDAGIDAIYIDDEEKRPTIHVFSFKYTDKFEKINNNFPSSELTNLKMFITDLMSKSETLISRVNPILSTKIKDIWKIFDDKAPKIIIHLSSNLSKGVVSEELKDFKDFLKHYHTITVREETIEDLLRVAISKDRTNIDCKLKVIDKNYFEKSSGDVKALIANVDVRELLKIITNDEDLRLRTDIEDYDIIKSARVDENVFEDNVRIYLKQKTKINKNITATALSEEAFRFFYYNNGITITCSNFTYQPNLRAPSVHLENLQIVNGSQTLHSLFDAFCTNSSHFNDMDILCRIYETKNEDLSLAIAEYTNSQNPVTSRDIRANDYTQRKLEVDLQTFKYFYERKKGQHFSIKDKSKIIDAEKAGQAILAFYLDKPAEAKDAKRIIFAEEYDKIFADDVDAKKVILAFECFYYVESIKKKLTKLIASEEINSDNDFALSASYYIMYVISLLMKNSDIEFNLESFNENKKALYHKAFYIIKEAVNKEITGLGRKYNHRAFFKAASPKTYIDLILNESLDFSKEKDFSDLHD